MKQALFLTVPTRESFYGGAAGGGKSSGLLMAGLMYVDDPNYHALLLRRHFTDLIQADALIPRAHEWLGGTAASWNDNDRQWTFPSGSTLTFGYMSGPRDHERYQGAAWQFCVAAGTPILMADGSYRAVNALAVGDAVMTLEGPRRVTRTLAPRVAACVRADVYDGAGELVGSQVQSETHAVLTPRGWLSFADTLDASRLCGSSSSTGCRSADRCVSPSCTRCRASARSPGIRPTDRTPARAGSRPPLDHRSSSAASACVAPAALGSCDGSSGGERARQQQPSSVTLEAVLHVPEPRSLSFVTSRLGVAHGTAGVPSPIAPPGCPVRCSAGCGRCGGRSRPSSADGRAHLVRLADAERRSPTDSPAGDRAQVRRCNRARRAYVHPYTTDVRRTDERLTSGSVVMTPCGTHRVIDITVEGVSHYITTTGLVNRNCGWDELTQFPENPYRYMFSRQRRPEGSTLPLRMMSGGNPGGIGHDWVFERLIVGGTLPQRFFMPASLDDNPHLDRAEYAKSLEELDPITRDQLLRGIWVLPKGARTFQRLWWRGRNRFDPTDESLVVRTEERWISFDTANTDDEDNAYTAWTVGDLVVPQGGLGRRLLLRDAGRERLQFPDLVQTMEQVARRWNHDGKLRGVIIEDKASGTSAYQTLVASAPAWLADKLFLFTPRVSKEQRWGQAAVWCKLGCCWLPHAHETVPWLGEFEAELFGLPDSEWKDWGDAWAQLCLWLEHILAESHAARGGGLGEAA